jgi:hypothetical protein
LIPLVANAACPYEQIDGTYELHAEGRSGALIGTMAISNGNVRVVEALYIGQTYTPSVIEQNIRLDYTSLPDGSPGSCYFSVGKYDFAYSAGHTRSPLHGVAKVKLPKATEPWHTTLVRVQ